MKKNYKSKIYSQNNIAKRNLAYKLVEISSINENDTVVDIGAGRGRLTEPLLGKAKQVVAIEIDEKLCELLKSKFSESENLKIINADFLSITLLKSPYKVLANIPFAKTADTIRKLTHNEYLEEAFIVVQKEAAKKFMGKPYDNKNQMMSALLKPFFDLDISYEFKRTDFEPVPRVDSVLLHIKRKKTGLIDESDKSFYEDFIVWFYNKNRASYMKFEEVLNEFNKLRQNSDERKRILLSNEAVKIKNA